MPDLTFFDYPAEFEMRSSAGGILNIEDMRVLHFTVDLVIPSVRLIALITQR
jgi:hypothetical protein